MKNWDSQPAFLPSTFLFLSPSSSSLSLSLLLPLFFLMPHFLHSSPPPHSMLLRLLSTIISYLPALSFRSCNSSYRREPGGLVFLGDNKDWEGGGGRRSNKTSEERKSREERKKEKGGTLKHSQNDI